MRHRFGRKSGEWHYLAIKPCIIAERLLPADPAFGSTLVDYKFYCFDGKPRYCQVCYERTTPSHAKKELYDARTWEDLGRYVRHTGDAPSASAFRVPSRSTRCSRRPSASPPDSAWCAWTSTRSKAGPSSGR